jgi:hypothetical protein
MPRLRWLDRIVLTTAGLTMLALLATAARLTPSPRGMGTHQQLGLPPCTVVGLFGVRCPSCGMTTAWSHMTRGNLLAAVRVNAGGALLAVLAAIGGPWFAASGMLGRWVARPPKEMWVFGAAMLVAIVTLIQWTLRISLGW